MVALCESRGYLLSSRQFRKRHESIMMLLGFHAFVCSQTISLNHHSNSVQIIASIPSLRVSRASDLGVGVALAIEACSDPSER